MVEVYDAELEGIYQAAKKIYGQRRFRKKKVIIFSDSQAAVCRAGQLGPGQGKHRARQRHDLATRQIKRGGSLTVEWVPGHYDVEGNKRADKLAKAAVQLPPNHRRTEVSITHLLREIKAAHDNRWKTRWDNTPAELKGKTYVGDWKRTPDRLFLEDRIVCSTITQLRTGHGHFGSFLHRMGFRDSDRCTCVAGPRETPQHLLFSCLQYSKTGWQLPNPAEYPSIRRPSYTAI
jgi:hypothetical protein